MVHQVGTTLHTDDRGIARSGIIIRHLVLPGFTDNSIGVLKLIASTFSPTSIFHLCLSIIHLTASYWIIANRKSQVANPYIVQLLAVSTKPSSKHFMLTVSPMVGYRISKATSPTVPTSLKTIPLRRNKTRPRFPMLAVQKVV